MGPDGYVYPELKRAIVPAAPRSPLVRAGFVFGGAGLVVAASYSSVNFCLMAALFDIPCPGCGMTRAAKAIAHGDVAAAIALHPLSPVVLPLVAALLASQAVRYVRDGAPIATGKIPRWLEVSLGALAALLFGVWIARFFGFFGGPVSVY
ncbi:MAG: DUF2752 domain-containing protein [Polyangiaceae bacterium]